MARCGNSIGSPPCSRVTSSTKTRSPSRATPATSSARQGETDRQGQDVLLRRLSGPVFAPVEPPPPTRSPPPAWFTGDFSAVPQLALYDPNTGNPNGTGRQPFPNNIVPVNRISPISKQLLQYFPQPNLPGLLNNYIINVPFRYNGNSYDARVDHNFSEHTKVFAKMNTSRTKWCRAPCIGPVVGDGTTAKDYTITGR